MNSKSLDTENSILKLQRKISDNDEFSIARFRGHKMHQKSQELG